MNARIEPVTIRFGKSPSATTTKASGGWCGIPGRIPDEGFVELADAAHHFAANRLGQSGVVFKIPPKHASDGPVRAIAIAPDSPIEACDIYINGQSGKDVFRISPGVPWIGHLTDSDMVRVVPIREIPYLGLRAGIADPANPMAYDEFIKTTCVWDCTVAPDDSLPFDPQIVAPNVMLPLRLHFYRGDVLPPVAKGRAPYGGTLVVNFGGENFDDTVVNFQASTRMIVIVDGRRRVRVQAAQTDDGTATMAVYGVEGFPSDLYVFTPGGFSDSQINIPAYKQLLAATPIPGALGVLEPDFVAFDYMPASGNPYFAFAIDIEVAAPTLGMIGTGAVVVVRAWDE